ncbi:MAG: CPBP family intramembrane metalloprotease [Planctomycetes bacterium]|nr:CPBP family intramembrane metalloprotease [Planctomycetota bacterium]
MSGGAFLDGERRPRLVWRLLIFGAGLVGIQIAVGIGAFIVLVIALAIRGERLELGPGGEAAFRDDWTLTLTIIASPFIAGGTTLLAAALRKWLDRHSVRSLGLPFPLSKPVLRIGGGTLAGAAPILLTAGALLAMGGFELTQPSAEWLALPLLAALILMAFFEEIAFRGYMLRNFLDAGRPVLGVAITSILFWLVHSLNPHAWSSPWNSINLLGAGVFLALVYLATDELWTPTAVHFGWNAAQGVLLDIPISGVETPGWIGIERVETHPLWLTGGEFGLEGSALTSLVLAAMIAGMFVVVKSRRRSRFDAGHPPAPSDEVFLADAVDEER